MRFTNAYSHATQRGAWGVYPLLGADRVLVSDINNGLFVINVDGVFGDLDGDGSVGVTDLLILLGAWGPYPASHQRWLWYGTSIGELKQDERALQ